jgi:hypothetical protein
MWCCLQLTAEQFAIARQDGKYPNASELPALTYDAAKSDRPFLRLVGVIEGPPDLSMRKGYSTTSAPVPAKPHRTTVKKRRTDIK